MLENIWRIGNHDNPSLLGGSEAVPETRTKRDNAPIIIFVLAVVAALSMLAGYFFKPNQSGVVTSTQPTQAPPTGDAKTYNH